MYTLICSLKTAKFVCMGYFHAVETPFYKHSMLCELISLKAPGNPPKLFFQIGIHKSISWDLKDFTVKVRDA